MFLEQVKAGVWVPLNGSAPPPAVAPSAFASAQPVSGVVPLAVTFSSAGSSAVSPATITGYVWSFGDGTSSTSPNPTHTYSAVGTYRVTLTVTDSAGKTGVAALTVTASVAPNPKSFVFGMSNSCSVPGSGLADGQNSGGGFTAGGDTLTNFMAIRRQFFNPDNAADSVIPLIVNRVFVTGLSVPTSIPRAQNNHANGIISHVSFKAPPADVLAGKWNAQLDALAASLFDGDAVTYWHEPENDNIDPTGWRDASKYIYRRMKAVRPGLRIGPCAIPFRYNSNGTVTWGASGATTTVTAASVDVGDDCDFRACDPYYMEGSTGGNLATEPHFQNWFNYHSTLTYSQAAPAARRGKKFPLGLMEFACVQTFAKRTRASATAVWGAWTYTRPYYDVKDATHPYTYGECLANSIDWFTSNGFVFGLFFNSFHADFAMNASTEGAATQETYRCFNLSPTDSDTAHVVPNALATFNAKMKQYGALGPYAML